ncbi:MAG: hypothetical protein Tsb009_32900 [Planctomycetaceae bacterium]
MIEPSFATLQSTHSNPPNSAIMMTVWGMIIVGFLLMFSAGVVCYVLLKNRNAKITRWSFLGFLGSLLAAVLIMGVFAAFAYLAIQKVEHSPQKNAPMKPVAIHRTQNGPEPDFHPLKPVPDWAASAKQRDNPEEKSSSSNRKNSSTHVFMVRGATVKDAEKKLIEKIRRELLERAKSGTKSQRKLYSLASTADSSEIEKHLVRRRFEQPGEERIEVSQTVDSKKELKNRVYRVFWEVDDSPEACLPFKEAAVTPRLWLLGGFIGLFTLLSGGISMYLRLDSKTNGQFRTRLKLATLSLILAGSVVILAVLTAI